MSDDAPKERVRSGNAAPPAEDKEANVDERPLPDAQKATIAEVRQVFKPKTAERKILHRAALRNAAAREEVELLNENLRRDSGEAGERPRPQDPRDQGRGVSVGLAGVGSPSLTHIAFSVTGQGSHRQC